MGTFLVGDGYTATPIYGIAYVIQPWPTKRITTAYQPRTERTASAMRWACSCRPEHRHSVWWQQGAIDNRTLAIPPSGPMARHGERLSNEAPLDKEPAYIPESTVLDTRGKGRVKELGGYVHHAAKSERWWPNANLPPLSGHDLRDIGYYDEATNYFRADWRAKVDSGSDHCADCGRSWRGASTGFGAYLRCHGILGENPQKVYLAGRPRTSAVSDNPKRRRVLRRYIALWDERFRAWGHEQHTAGVDPETAHERLLARPFDRGIEAQVAREAGVARRHVNRWVAEMLSTDARLLAHALAGGEHGPIPAGEATNWLEWSDESPSADHEAD